jgi:hypothetical protein
MGLTQTWGVSCALSTNATIRPSGVSPSTPYLFSWSPDGRWLLCGPDQIPGGLFLYSLEGRSLRKLDESEEAARWLPDSRRILFNKRGALILLDIVRAGARRSCRGERSPSKVAG